MDRFVFLRTSPREMAGLLEQLGARERRQFGPAALICATLCNLYRDSGSEPYTMSNFLPGSASEEEMEHQEFVEKVLRGETFEVDPEAAAHFRRQMEAAFANIKPGVTTEGPRGREEREVHGG